MNLEIRRNDFVEMDPTAIHSGRSD